MTPPATLTAIGILALILVTLGYAALCAVSPWAPCHRCDGLGKTRRRPTSKRWNPCRRCRATGLRLRLGRHLYNAARRAYLDTHR